MALFKRIQTLFLVLFLLFTETEQVFVKDGAKVTLICGNVKVEQNKCDGTSWLFSSVSDRSTTEEIVTHGQIGSRVKYKDRLSVTDECSLEIKPVQTQDAGVFTCRQFNKSGGYLPPDAQVHLSVVSLTEEEKEDKVELLCSVLTLRLCSGLQVQWKYPGTDSDSKDHPEIKHESKDCSASVSFKTSHFFYSSRHETFKCEVSSLGKTHLFTFGPEPETTTKNPTAATEDGSKPGPGSGTQGFNQVLWWAVGGAVAVTALITAAVVVFKWKRNSAKPQEMNRDKPADPEEGVSYASISFNKQRLDKNKSRDDEEEAVTYSSVKTPASEDPAQLYATVGRN